MVSGVVCLKELKNGDGKGEVWAFAGLSSVGSLRKFPRAYVEVEYMLRLRLRLRLAAIGQV